jgi:hypothetical protein
MSRTINQEEVMPTKSNTPAPEFPVPAILEFMSKYMIFSDDCQALAVALWIVHTYATDAAYTTPYLYVNSAEKRSGKTRLIEVCESIAKNPVMAGNLTASTLFRSMNPESVDKETGEVTGAGRSTLFIDEVDTIFTGAANEDLRSVLNSGYKSNGNVLRTIGGEVKHFSTFGAKLLAGIDNGEVPDTVRDRCIRINLKRKKESQEVQRFQYRKVQEEAADLIEKIEAWVQANMDALLAAEPKPIDSLGDRAWDIAEPLIAIAERGKGWGPRARRCLETLLAPEEEPLSINAQVLKAAKEYMEKTGEKRVSSATLSEMTDLSQKRIGVLLASYGIAPRVLRFGQMQARGYDRADFADAWERYL